MRSVFSVRTVSALALWLTWLLSSVGLAHAQGKSVRTYQLDATNSEITIALVQEGVIRKRHPRHTVLAKSYTSKIVLPKDEAKTTIELIIEAKSLINVDKTMGDFERKGFQHVLQTQVLESEKHPQISFKSIALVDIKKMGEQRTFALAGELTFHGVTRRVRFPVTATFGKDTLTAKGSAQIKQSDFGITPYADTLGAIKIGDEMTIHFAVAAKLQ